MNLLTKEQTLFIRDETGNLIPQTVELELLDGKPCVKILPMMKAELSRFVLETQKNGDPDRIKENEIIAKYCIEPKYTLKELEDLKPLVANALFTAILSLATGVEQSKIGKASGKTAIDIAMEEVAKKKE